MNRPAISVVLPTRNRAATLDRAVRSVLGQTWRDLELIVVDDGSSDDTRAVLNALRGEANLTVLHLGEGRGCAAARNVGVDTSRGHWLAFQDSDDEWHPDHLAAAIATAAEAGADVVYGDLRRVARNGTETLSPAPEMRVGRLIDERRKDYQAEGIGIQSSLIQREALAEAGTFDERLGRYIDLDVFARLALTRKFAKTGRARVRYYAGPGISTDRKALVDARRLLMEKHAARLGETPGHLAWQRLHLASALAAHGQTRAAVAQAFRAWRAASGKLSLRELATALTGRRNWANPRDGV